VVPRSDRGHEAIDPPTRFQGEVARVQELSIATARAEYDELRSAIGSSGLALEMLQDLDSEDHRQEEISSGGAVAGEPEIFETFEVANQTGQKYRIAPEISNIEKFRILDVGGSGFQPSTQLEGNFQQKKSPQLSAFPTPTPEVPLGGRTERIKSRTKGLTTQEELQRQEEKKSRWRRFKWVENLF
jgi:hypothetical protein